MKPLLEVAGLSVAIDGAPILTDVSFTFHPGEMVALLGPSGSGKSTLLGTICGQLRPSSGSVRPGTGAGFVPQIPYAARSPLSVAEVVSLGRPRRGLRTSSDERRRSTDLLERLGLAGLEDRRLGELSGGQRQRVAIAAALAFDTPLLLLDEPTSGADPVLADEVLALLRSLTDADRAVLLAGHDASRLVPCSDRVLGLVAGRLVLDAPADAVDVTALERVYGRPRS